MTLATFLRTLGESIVRNAEQGGGSASASAAPAADAKPADAAASDPGAILYGNDAPKPDAAKPDATAAKPDEVAKDDAKKAEGEKPADKAADDAALKEVPADGKYDFKLPDGVELDAELATEAMPLLKEAGVSREGANKLAAFMAQQRQKEAAALSENWDKVNRDWQAAAKSDAEVGGDKFDSSLASANKVLTKFGTPELREYLTASGGGNHPELIRLLARVGNAFSDDKPAGSTPVTDRATDPVSILYAP